MVRYSSSYRNEKQEKLFQKWKKEVVNFLLTCKLGMDAKKLEGQLSDVTGEETPVKDMGLNWLSFLYECRSAFDVGVIRGESPNDRYTRKFLFVRASAVDPLAQNVLVLVKDQERSKTKKRRDGKIAEPTRNQVDIVDPQCLIIGGGGGGYVSQNQGRAYGQNNYVHPAGRNSQSRSRPYQQNNNYVPPAGRNSQNGPSRSYGQNSYSSSGGYGQSLSRSRPDENNYVPRSSSGYGQSLSRSRPEVQNNYVSSSSGRYGQSLSRSRPDVQNNYVRCGGYDTAFDEGNDSAPVRENWGREPSPISQNQDLWNDVDQSQSEPKVSQIGPPQSDSDSEDFDMHSDLEYVDNGIIRDMPIRTQPSQTQSVRNEPIQIQSVRTESTQLVSNRPEIGFDEPDCSPPVLNSPCPQKIPQKQNLLDVVDHSQNEPKVSQIVPPQSDSDSEDDYWGLHSDLEYVDNGIIRDMPIRTQHIRTQSIRTEPIRAQSVRTQPSQTQSIRTQPIQTQSVRTQLISNRPEIGFDEPDCSPPVLNGPCPQKTPQKQNLLDVVNHNQNIRPTNELNNVPSDTKPKDIPPPIEMSPCPQKIPQTYQFWHVVIHDVHNSSSEYNLIFRKTQEDRGIKELEPVMKEFYTKGIGQKYVVRNKPTKGFYVAYWAEKKIWVRAELKNDAPLPTGPVEVFFVDHGVFGVVDWMRGDLRYITKDFIKIPKAAYFGKIFYYGRELLIKKFYDTPILCKCRCGSKIDGLSNTPILYATLEDSLEAMMNNEYKN